MSKFPPTDTHTHTLTTHAYALAHAIKYAVFFIVTAFQCSSVHDSPSYFLAYAPLLFRSIGIQIKSASVARSGPAGINVWAGRSLSDENKTSISQHHETKRTRERTFLLLVIFRKFRLVTCGTFRSFRRPGRVRVVQRMKHVDGRNVSEQENGGISREVVVTVTDVLSEPGLRCAYLRIGVCVLFESFPPWVTPWMSKGTNGFNDLIIEHPELLKPRTKHTHTHTFIKPSLWGPSTIMSVNAPRS